MGMCAFRSASDGNKDEFHQAIELGNVDAAKILLLNCANETERDALWKNKKQCKALETSAGFWLHICIIRFPESDHMLRFFHATYSQKGWTQHVKGSSNKDFADFILVGCSEEEQAEIRELQQGAKRAREANANNDFPENMLGSRSGVILYQPSNLSCGV